MPKGIAAAESIMKATGNKNITVKEIDLSSMSTVRQFAREFMETEKRCLIKQQPKLFSIL